MCFMLSKTIQYCGFQIFHIFSQQRKHIHYRAQNWQTVLWQEVCTWSWSSFTSTDDTQWLLQSVLLQSLLSALYLTKACLEVPTSSWWSNSSGQSGCKIHTKITHCAFEYEVSSSSLLINQWWEGNNNHWIPVMHFERHSHYFPWIITVSLHIWSYYYLCCYMQIQT